MTKTKIGEAAPCHTCNWGSLISLDSKYIFDYYQHKGMTRHKLTHYSILPNASFNIHSIIHNNGFKMLNDVHGDLKIKQLFKIVPFLPPDTSLKRWIYWWTREKPGRNDTVSVRRTWCMLCCCCRTLSGK